MAKVSRRLLVPPLRAADLGEKEDAIATITEVRVDVPTKDTKSGKSTIVLFKEYGGKGLYLNGPSTDHLIDGISDESTDWIGRRVRLVKVRSENPDRRDDPNAPAMVTTVWVAQPSEWPKK